MLNPLNSLLLGSIVIIFMTLLFWPNGGLIGYLQRNSKLSKRVLREDALKHIHKCDRHHVKTTLESIAGALSISTSKAANLMRDMQNQGLIFVEADNFKLTPKGHDYALRIIRAHRLWERYLAEETGFDEATWHDIADRYEHQISFDQAEQLSARLGNPTHDPHGDPIPTSEGELVLHDGKPLNSMPIDTPLQIVHMEDEPETVYAQLVAEGLYPGMEIRVVESTPSRIRFWANDSEDHVLAPIVAASISVIPIPEQSAEAGLKGEPLHKLKIGQQGEVLALSPRLRGVERRRMMDLGILPGTIIGAEMVSAGGDPVAYRIRGALIALRKDQAELIRINAPLEV
jgi:DtxR family Mn-dependent transcriptional regulator